MRLAVLALSIFLATPEQAAVPSEDIGVPILQASANHMLGAPPISKGVYLLPDPLESAVEVTGFNVQATKLVVRDRIPKKLRGKVPAGYVASGFGVPHELTDKDSCIFWLKPAYSFVVISWSWDEKQTPAQIVLTVDYWLVK